MPTSPPVSDPLYTAALRNWFSSLREHDPADVRGLLEGLLCVTALVVSRIPESKPSPMTDAYAVKLAMWKSALASLLNCPEFKNGRERG